MASRLDLHEAFCTILGTRNVYFQPPASVKMQYPAIRYSLRNYDGIFANNSPYVRTPSYEVILIDKNPESEFVDKILQLPYCSFDRPYAKDNLNHWVFTIYNT